MTLGEGKPSVWVRFGRYGRTGTVPVLWRIAGRTDDAAVWLISAGVLDSIAFDLPSEKHPDGDNRWRDSSLRHWLNSADPGAAPGFLLAFEAWEQQALVHVELQTEVCAGYSAANRAEAVDTTKDRVWIASWEEYKKLPKSLRGGARSESFLRDHPEELTEKQTHWSRSPIARLGVALLEHWERKKEHTNSGAAYAFAVRPCIALSADLVLSGKGSELEPFEPPRS